MNHRLRGRPPYVVPVAADKDPHGLLASGPKGSKVWELRYYTGRSYFVRETSDAWEVFTASKGKPASDKVWLRESANAKAAVIRHMRDLDMRAAHLNRSNPEEI